jgi:hypothetical protein
MADLPEDQCVWLAMLFTSRVADVVGAVRSSPRLHWTRQEAREEAADWITEMGIGPITWQAIDDEIMVGRTFSHFVVVRGIPLPYGDPPA